MMSRGQVRGYLASIVGDNERSVWAVDSIRSLVMHSDDPSHFKEIGTAIDIQFREADHRLILGSTDSQVATNPDDPKVSSPSATSCNTARAGQVATATAIFAIVPYEALLGLVLLPFELSWWALKQVPFMVMGGSTFVCRWIVLPFVYMLDIMRPTRIFLSRFIQRAVQRLVVLMLAWLEGLRDKLALEFSSLALPPAP
ncbi:hypothetical protein NMY22_g13976 [Coprinellus aureogranulatus]|nr:hypothetical protein NMY22_g13976 [Coprinellus aureogranulatus]